MLAQSPRQAQPEDQKQGQAPAGGGTSTDPEPYRFVPANPPAEPLAFSNWLAANLPLASKYRVPGLVLGCPCSSCGNVMKRLGHDEGLQKRLLLEAAISMPWR
eukprot:scaffold46540_cov12-Tisochrysis_lutea.AAC.1